MAKGRGPEYLPDEDEIYDQRAPFLRMIRDEWGDESVDSVMIHDSPSPAHAMELINRYGVKQAEDIIRRMNGE